ncbi:MAG: efflux RND transporter periplasmic adaptor subunit, partial [Lachnospiraceae bacterium]|nr:efflux RND transporter periplasmic adaptor subunit [Lachnospiraceae bacterium]
MNENRKKRRDWVKNAAIIFLAVMLVLTFFSNTILNYSLPEVAVQYVQPGNITAKVRGTGTI